MNKFERPKTAQEAVLLEIRERLLNGRIQPGDAIRPDAIGEQLGVSAVPVREALRILEGEGQVIYRPHRGYLVVELDINDLKEIHSLRALLEAEAVRHALPNLSEADIEQMRAAADRMENSEGDILEVKAANRRLHFTLMEAAKMPHLLRLIGWLWDSSESYCSRYFMLPENRQRTDQEHREIIEAAVAGDVDDVIEQLNVHRQHALIELEQDLATIGAPESDLSGK